MSITAKKISGFTLIEVVLAVGIFLIVMLGIMQIFTTSFKAYKESRKLQGTLEAGQFATNAMAKELRTSSLIDHTSDGTSFSVTFIDYSQNRCIQYVASGVSGKITKYARNVIGADPNAKRQYCQDNGVTLGDLVGDLFTSGDLFTTGLTQANINYVESKPIGGGSTPLVGKVTISLTFGLTSKPATLQTTVSLRDFNYVGI